MRLVERTLRWQGGLLVAAGVPGRHYPHRWRDTYATALLLTGVDLHVVQRLLGHEPTGGH